MKTYNTIPTYEICEKKDCSEAYDCTRILEVIICPGVKNEYDCFCQRLKKTVKVEKINEFNR